MQKRKNPFLFILLFSTVLLLLSGCSKDGNATDIKLPVPEKLPEQTETSFPSDETENDLQDSSTVESEVPEYLHLQEALELPPATESEDIREALLQAMEGSYEGFSMDVTEISFDQSADIDIKNLYYQIISEQSHLKYIYDVASQLTDQQQLTVTFSYMPYKTGKYEEHFQGIEVGSLNELLQTASENLAQDSVAIRITNPSLDVTEMNQILRQAGEGFFVCMLNRDGTEITIQSGQAHDKEESLQYLAEVKALAEEVLSKRITKEMTDREKALALYSYVAETVKYDYRYYNDRDNMPYISTTAYGALQDGLAICGGCAHSVEKLFTLAGIPCHTVSGDWNGENHMWNIAKIDGEWLYFDSTGDLGRQEDFRFFAVTADELVGHSWEQESVDLLLKMEKQSE